MNKSLRYLLAREILTVLILVMATMSGIFMFWQSRVDGERRGTRTKQFREQIERDQDTILLQIILKRTDELNAYIENLKHLFADVPFCLDLNPPIPDVMGECAPKLGARVESIGIYGNRNHQIHILERKSSPGQRLTRALASPYLWLIAVTAAMIAMFLRFRFATLLTRPLSRIRERLDLLAVGERGISTSDPSGIEEWDQIEVSLDELIGYLRDAEREQNDAGRDELARQVAHDIRSPLSALRIAAQVLTEIPYEKRRIIEGAVDRIDEVANALASRAEVGEQLDLRPLLERLVDEKKLEYATRKVELTFLAKVDTPDLRVRISASVLKRVLSNLINNAIEAAEQSARVSIELTAEDKLLLIKVIDSGKGLSTKDQSRVQRGHTFGKVTGQGLGLKLARRMAREWNGSLTLTSVQGIGTIITIALPAEDVRSISHQSLFSTTIPKLRRDGVILN